ncbi:unnamed protein product, partial [Symbiodinium sp. CCMP2592]
ARLCAGHLALEKRAEFFGTISDEVAEEVSKLQESIERSRWALEDKMAPAEVGEDPSQGEPSDPFLEADDGELASFLAFQESEADLVRNALSAFRSHNEAVVQRFADEGEQARECSGYIYNSASCTSRRSTDGHHIDIVELSGLSCTTDPNVALAG